MSQGSFGRLKTCGTFGAATLGNETSEVLVKGSWSLSPIHFK